MRKWGSVIAVLYALIVLVLLTPATMLLVANTTPSLSDFAAAYKQSIVWILGGIVIVSQIVLLWISVDTTQRRLKPRTPILVSAITTGLLLTLVSFVAVLALLLAIWGENAIQLKLWEVIAVPILSWIVWGVVFYRLTRDSTDALTRAVSWLFRGSVLELLIAVPAHVMVRRRHECCAPMVTGFGITSGIAIMLLSFGPSVLLLFKKRMERYAAKELVAK
jgi:hypothetical protein